MKKSFALVGLAMASLFSGAAMQPEVPAADQANETVYAASVAKHTPKAKAPKTIAQATRKVEARPSAFPFEPIRYARQSGPRRVKYGKSRWVQLG